MKKIIITIASLIPMLSVGQEGSQVGLMVGQQAVEVSASYTTEIELIFGGAVAVVNTGIAEKRANNNDRKTHDFKGDFVPAVFGLIGGKFDDFSMIGKLGTAYLEQDINGIPDSQNFYFTAGIILDYKILDSISIRASYDSVSGALIGASYRL
jgi:hypothetical protein